MRAFGASWVNLGVMAYILHKRGLFVADALLKRRLGKLCVASMVMALALWLCEAYFSHFYEAGMLMKVIGLSGTIALGMVVYGISVLVLKAYDMQAMRALVRRR
jgi:putative peptidoglycan lipid II flippase